MFTGLSVALTALLASKGLAVAGKILPYVAALVPVVVFVVALIVGYYHADTLGRWLLALAVVNEAIIAVGCFVAYLMLSGQDTV